MNDKILEKLTVIIKKRKATLPNNSYVASLFKKGNVKIANKVGEEAVETISAFLAQEKIDLIEESADLIFHLLILLENAEVSFEEVLKVLEKRMEND
tara:strand:- start:9014 stop:9304 length:291 start_codon:yes stop_codon:yes gene_type:complete